MTRILPVLACAALLCLAPVAAHAQPAAAELEFWRSAQRIDTAEAYQAYLAAYPTGTFAPLARASLAKLGTAAPAVPAVPPAATATPGAGLRPVDFATSSRPPRALASERSSGSVSFSVGDVFAGPGVLTVGWLGAKRQLVLPPGRWLVLAAQDYRSADAVPAPMTAIAFGLFQGEQVRSLIVANFNRQPVGAGNTARAPSQMLPRWLDFERCEDTQLPTLHRDTRVARTLRRCERALVPGGAATAADWPGPSGWSAALRSAVAAAGGALPAFHLRSEVHVFDNRHGYFGITRLDCLAQSDAAGACAAADAVPRTLVDARIDWLKSYAALVQQGADREFDLPELTAEQSAAAPATAARPAGMALQP